MTIRIVNPITWLEKKMLLTIFRHLAAAGAAYVVSWGAKQGVALDAEQMTALMLAIYAAAEKLLKPAAKALGEKQS